MDSKYWFDIDGKKVPNDEAMLSKLLDENILFCNSRVYVDPHSKERAEETIVLFILINDVFVPAADAESLTLSELPKLFTMFEQNNGWGVVKFVALKRGWKPRMRVVESMKRDNCWDDELENLKENTMP